MTLKYGKYDDLNKLRNELATLDIKTNNINLLIFDIFVLFNSRKKNIKNDFTYKCETEFIKVMLDRAKHLNKYETSKLIDNILFYLNEDIIKKKAFKNLCIEEIEKNNKN